MTTLADLFFAAAARKADKVAIVCDGESVTYHALAQRVARLAHALAERGVAPGDAIGVLAENSIAFAVLMLAAADLGAVLVPLSPSLPDDAALRGLLAGDVRHVCAQEARLETLRAHPHATAIAGAWFAIDALTTLIASSPSDAPRVARGEAEAAYILTMTSGSTGNPKAIVLSQRAKIERARAAIALYGVTEDDRIVAATPLYHSLAERLVLMPLITGATSLLMTRFTPASWLNLVHEERATFTIAVSSQLSQIARHVRVSPDVRAQCASLRCVVSSSAPLNRDDKALILVVLPGEFHECYGASEVAIASSLNLTARDAPLESVGLAAPGVEIAILGDHDRVLPNGEVGQIACRTPMRFSGYFKRADLTDAAMRDGFFKTGDIGRLDENGALYYLGRTKEIIITGGINVIPSDIEAVIAALDGVGECAAFGLPDERLGEIVSVAIAPAHGVTARAVRRACAERLADFQQPQRIFFVDALPRNAMGKLQRRALPEAVCALEARAA